MKRNIENKTFGENSFFNDGKNMSVHKSSNALNLAWRPYWGEGTKDNIWAKDIKLFNCNINGAEFGEGLKLSFPFNVIVEDCNITGGYEDVIDIVRGGNVLFKNCNFYSSIFSNQIATIKGGAHSIRFENCFFQNNNPKMKYMFHFGGWSDYDKYRKLETKSVEFVDCIAISLYNKVRIAKELFSVSQNYQGIKTGNNVENKLRIPRILTNVFFFLRGKFTSRNVSIEDRKTFDEFELPKL
jgi:hypothetical protein